MRADDRDQALLKDMLKACSEVLEFMQGAELDTFIEDRQLALAVERCLEIVGEAAGRVSLQFRSAHPEIRWQKIRGLRNILAHEYGHIESEAIYTTAVEDVPLLLATLEAILTGEHGVREARVVGRLTRRSRSKGYEEAHP